MALRRTTISFSQRGPLLTKRSALFGVSLMSIAVFVSLGVAGQKGGTIKPLAARGVPESLLNAEFDFGDNYYACLPLGSQFNLERAIHECSATTSANRTVLLLGDSHAAQYAAALRHGAETIGYDFQQLTANSCTPFADFSLYEVNCESYVESVTEFLAQTQPDLVVLSQRWTKSFENSGFDNGEGGIELGSVDAVRVGQFEPGTEGYQNFLADRFKQSLERLLEETTVVLIGPSPEAGWNVPQKLQKSVFSRETSYENLELSTSFNRFLERNGAVLERLSKLEHPDLFYYKPHEALCDRQIKGRCVNFWQGAVLYYDDDHLSQTGSMFIAPELLKVVQMALGD